jgi:hypothetical protein
MTKAPIKVALACISAAMLSASSCGIQSGSEAKIKSLIREAERFCKIPLNSTKVIYTKNLRSGARSPIIDAGCFPSENYICMEKFQNERGLSFVEFPLNNIGCETGGEG